VVKNNSLVSLSSLMKHFEKIKIFPQKIEEQVVKDFASILVKIQSSVSHKKFSGLVLDSVQQDKLDEQRKILTFADFVQIVGFMSAHVNSYAHRFMTHSAPRGSSSSSSTGSGSQDGYHVGWHVIMQTAAEYFLHTALNKWLVHEFDSNKYISSAVPSTPSQLASTSKESLLSGDTTGHVLRNKALGMSPSSLLWIARQGNLVTSLTDIHSLYLRIVAATVRHAESSKSPKSVQMHQSSVSSIVPTSKIPGLLSTLATLQEAQRTAETMNKEGKQKELPNASSSIIYQGDAYSQYTQSLIGSSDLATEASIVAMAAPGLFFASPQPLPSLLGALYSPAGATCVSLLAGSIQRILAEIEIDAQSLQEATTDRPRDEDEGWNPPASSTISLTKFVELFHKSSVVPVLVTDEVLLKMSNYVLGRDMETGSLLTEREFIDLFFACSQVCLHMIT
jgi:hypothetical protein